VDEWLVVVINKDPIFLERIKSAGSDLGLLATNSCHTAALVVDAPHLKVVILDPSSEGSFGLLRSIRATNRQIHVIGVTESSELRLQLQAAGVDPIFDPAVETETLLAAVRERLVETKSPEPVSEILIVDDEEDIRDLLAQTLARDGYRVLEASDGDKALALLETHPDIAVVLLDLRIPGHGGMEILAAIHRHNPKISVIMVTGVVDREIAAQAIRLGAFDYVIKPFDVGELDDLVAAALGHRDYVKRPWWKRLIGYAGAG
jgi:CheY-like chemotaxis protein